ncbi:hypothetical protein [Pedobacter sp. N23S346]|uniref:hypothetical protein n=1 Tax=Pedobacter sp. N23S346 TaxID=3402750 RepID=UPI003AC67665
MIEENLNKIPPWMKRMHNGSLAEARARAFLLDRFWILERSIDIDGADFIIQRRLNQANLLDREGPRFGVVQVKYFASSKTEQRIHQDYIVDKEGLPRKEFFILCHSGDERSNEHYFLTAETLHEDFKLRKTKNGMQYVIPGRKILSNLKYKIIHPTIVLDRMEQLLKLADFTSNRKFVSWSLPSVEAPIDDIEGDYKEPIPNWGMPVPEGFQSLKQSVHASLLQISKVYDQLKEITRTSDPMKAVQIMDELKSSCYHHGWAIPLPEELGNPDFENACRNVKQQVDRLKSDGLLDVFLGLKGHFKKQIIEFLSGKDLLDESLVHWFSFNTDETFQIKDIRHCLEHFNDFIGSHQKLVAPDFKGTQDLILISPGKFLAFWRPAILLKEYTGENKLAKYFKQSSSNLEELCLKEILDERYYIRNYSDGTRS